MLSFSLDAPEDLIDSVEEPYEDEGYTKRRSSKLRRLRDQFQGKHCAIDLLGLAVLQSSWETLSGKQRQEKADEDGRRTMDKGNSAINMPDLDTGSFSRSSDDDEI